MAGTQDDELPHPLDNVKPKPYKELFKNRTESKFVDPCAEASKASLACMDKNDYDRDKCMAYFQAYRDCKKDWLTQRRGDRLSADKT